MKSTVFVLAVCLATLHFAVPVNAAAGTGVSQPLTALFESRVIVFGHRPKRFSRLWHFIRQADRVEKQMPEQHRDEVWFKDKDGSLKAYQFISDKHRLVIEYNRGDLKSISNYPSWNLVASILPAELRGKLKYQGATRIFGHPASLYRGNLNGADIELTWLDDVMLPAHYREIGQRRDTQIELKKLYNPKDAPWKARVTTNYRFMDFADVGDNESDPALIELTHGR
ncbi:MAG TPA: hypothetical protein ENK33_05040 [Desulfobacterales bacterium]|nr:hypothetical protein [Desulfobacterales bacterium]